MVALQLHKLETQVQCPLLTQKLSGLVAQFCNPATGEQGYLSGSGHLDLNTWLGLDLTIHC